MREIPLSEPVAPSRTLRPPPRGASPAHPLRRMGRWAATLPGLALRLWWGGWVEHARAVEAAREPRRRAR